MKKNNKGFFLAETIVVLALVTTTMAFVYPNVSKLYNDYSSRIIYYDQTQDLLFLKEIYNAYKPKIEEQTKGTCGSVDDFIGAKKFDVGAGGCSLLYAGQSKDHCPTAGIRLYQNQVMKKDGVDKYFYVNKLDGNYMGTDNSVLEKTCSSTSVEVCNQNFIDSGDISGKGDLDGTANAYGLVRIYLTGYMTSPSFSDYNFNKYLKRLRKVTNEPNSYRLIGVFRESNNLHRFASIKITTDSFCDIY